MGELFSPTTSTQQDRQLLLREEIEGYAFPPDKDSGSDLATYHLQRGQDRKFNGSKKIRVLQRLQPNLIFEDLVTQIVILALLEGHFADFSSIDTLMAAKPLPQGSQIKSMNSSLKPPIFRLLETTADVTSLPLASQWFQNRMVALGMAAGFHETSTS